jgi:hypothetical protein
MRTRFIPAALRERVEAACERGAASIHSTGSSPGVITEAVALVLTSIQRRLDGLTIDEFADLSQRNSPGLLFDVMGFGKPQRRSTSAGCPTAASRSARPCSWWPRPCRCRSTPWSEEEERTAATTPAYTVNRAVNAVAAVCAAAPGIRSPLDLPRSPPRSVDGRRPRSERPRSKLSSRS